jgi:argininosuccinate lyase
MKLWGGRFSDRLDAAAWKLNASIDFDRRLALQDVRGSLAWADALERAGILSIEERAQIRAGLGAIEAEFQNGTFLFQKQDEDIHTAVERRLGELIGAPAGKLHSGRSRNDQVVTDLRLWLLDHLPALDEELRRMQGALLDRARTDLGTLMPGYTHLQPAQPILLSHWWLSHFWPLERDRGRLAELEARTSVLPLGSGALAGAPFPIDRKVIAAELGFATVSENSIDAVSDRDFAAEFLFCAALVGIHLSRLAEAVILFSSAEFGYFTLPDAFTTGSSLMPQKKNPDMFELARGKSGTLLGYLVGLMTTLKGLPSAYDKDLQEDKVPLFNAWDTLNAVLPVLANALEGLSIQGERMHSRLGAELMATDLADYLVEKGIPFRQAHTLVGEVVKLSGRLGVNLDELQPDEYRSISPDFGADLAQVFSAENSVNRRRAYGGTAPSAVEEQILSAQAALDREL